MPGEQTAVSFIEAISQNSAGASWLFAIGVLVILAAVAVKLAPAWREYVMGKLEIDKQREVRKADEARMRDARDRDNAANTARMVDAMNRQADGDKAMAAALTALDARLEVSQHGSRAMQDSIGVMNEAVGSMALKVDDIHECVVVKQAS